MKKPIKKSVKPKKVWKTVDESEVRFEFKGIRGGKILVNFSSLLDGGFPIDPDTGDDLEFVKIEHNVQP